MHPDKGTGNEAAMIKVNEAYGVLSDTSTKREYDSTLPSSRHNSKQAGGYYGSDDFYGYSPSSGQNTSHFYTYEKPNQEYDFRGQSDERAFWEDEFRNDYYSKKRTDYKKDDERIRREEQAFREEYFDHHNFTPTGSYEDFEFHHEHYGDDGLGEDEFGYFDEKSEQHFNQAFHEHLKNQYSKSQQKTSKNPFSESAHEMYENYRREVFDKHKPKDRSKQFSYEYEKPNKKSRRSHQKGYTEVDNAFWFEISTLYTAYATGEVDDAETGLYIEGLIDTYELTESAKSLILDEVAERFPGFDFSRVSYDSPRSGSFHYQEADYINNEKKLITLTVKTGSEYVYKNMGSNFGGKADYDMLEEHLFGPRKTDFAEKQASSNKSKNTNKKKKKKKRKKSNDKQNNNGSKNK